MTREELLNDLYEWLDDECIPATMTADLSHDFADILRAKLDKIKKCEPIPPAEGAEEFLKSKGYAEAIKHPTDGIIAPTFTWSHVIELLQEYVIMQKPQPTAEGAEEILEKHFHATPYKLNIAQHRLALFAMQEFATLHAQRIAEKMVSERLREAIEQERSDIRQMLLDEGYELLSEKI